MEKETTKHIPSDESAVVAEAPPSHGSEKPPAIRTATDEQVKKAQRKTSAQHAKLFRRPSK